jgi:RHS repeat-associated protein
VRYSVDSAGRTIRVNSNRTYADMIGIPTPYTPDERLAQMKLGNDLWETHNYLPPGSPTLYMLGTTQGGWEKVKLKYNFSGTQNNGNVLQQVIHRPESNRTWTPTYTYDPLNRLDTANEAQVDQNVPWSQDFEYDRFGNGSVTTMGLAHDDDREPEAQDHYDHLTNRLNVSVATYAGYDIAGNQTYYAPFTLEYDAEGRNTKVKIGAVEVGSYAYDGDGRQVKKVWTSGTPSTTYFVYDALGRLAAEYSTLTLPAAEVSYMFTDMLGSVRAVTSQSKTVAERYDYLPFGRMLSAADNGRSASGCYQSNPDVQVNSRTPPKFTGKERDAETGLDYFGARYYSAAQGRFMSPDPVLSSARLWDPQSWNRYSCDSS